MAHVKTQVREGFIRVLSELPEIVSAHPASRLLRSFQRNDFPLAIVSVSESASVSAANGTPGNRQLQRDFQISVTLAVHDETVDAEDALDELSVVAEKALVRPSALGVGPLLFWKYLGSGAPTGQPTEDGFMLTQTLTYSCTVRTTDTDPTTIL